MMEEKRTEMSPWDAVSVLGGMIPGVTALGHHIGHGLARTAVQRLMGYWVMWHLLGGLEGLISSGCMSSASAYRQRTEFAKVFGVTVEDFAPELARQIREAVAK